MTSFFVDPGRNAFLLLPKIIKSVQNNQFRKSRRGGAGRGGAGRGGAGRLTYVGDSVSK